ncbi:MAG TPA: hypothetical protein VHT25_07755 [Solirubrobacteraceae bacterium]|jgi:hypothetical protein|nr:hypothetical protein [Solirubrobacteraceae bacterium]
MLACFVTLLAPATGQAALLTFGSPLSVPATQNTAEGLDYLGTNTAVPASPEAPNGYVHTYHFGADGALWNVQQPKGLPRAPATGQALKVSLEGCAVAASDGPPPLTQIHFQDLTPLPGGGAKINITSQAFDIPVCAPGGASGSTVTTYNPINLCVSAGDYVAFNEEGGFVGHAYQSGVPYEVLGRVAGARTASFIRGGATNNGDSLSPSDSSAMDGYAATDATELMMQVTLGTHGDATHICPGGKQGLPPALAPIRVSPQTDGVNHSRIVAVAIFCRVSPCKGVATLSPSGADTSTYAGEEIYGRVGFDLPSNRTVHLPIRVKSKLLAKIRAKHGVSVTLVAAVNGKAIAQRITVKIL